MKVEELTINIGIENEEEIKAKLTGIKQQIDDITQAAERLNNVLDEINGDNVPVIRCEDCQFYSGGVDGYGVCTRFNDVTIADDVVKDTDYCSRGKERNK